MFSFRAVQSPCRIDFEHTANLGRALQKRRSSLPLRCRAQCAGSIKGLMIAVRLAEKNCGSLIRVAADGDDCLHVALEKTIHLLRRVARDVDADSHAKRRRVATNQHREFIVGKAELAVAVLMRKMARAR